ncbi:unnamed protein product [Mytilus coruscus]|uniref:Uncharacterized protein n=1 Tax=Mytilus coruscus TaxID=42192 RepID=A0A6J8EUG5_MYTCO|nr:unnamed protein product [Mytilus coruscus]
MDRNICHCLIFFVMVVICSLNCNGMRNVVNLQKFRSIVQDRKFGIVLLQETFWDDVFIQNVKHMYEGDIYYSNGMDGRQGVAVLASKYYKDKIKCIYKDDQGRFIHVTYYENDILVNFVSLYAHNVVSDRCNFYDFVIDYTKDYTKDLDNLIIGGDFNTSLSMLDRGSKTCHINDEPYRKLTKLMDDNNLYDIWRARNPDCRIFSWKRISEGKLQQSRIDYFLVSRNMSSFVQSLYYNVTSMSDHSFVIMNLNCTCIERGPGLWVLNNTLLFNEEYVQRVKDIISQEKESELFHRDFLVWWDNLKYRIKRYSQTLSSDLAKQNKREYFRLERQINNLCEKAASGIVIDIAKLESLKLELSNFEIEKCKGAVLRTKAIWAVESIKNTKYFLNLEKYKQESNAIKELLNENDDTVSDTEDQANAFDRVSHTYLLEVLKKFSFGDRFVKWISIFYNGINSAVKCNGFLTKYFVIKNGIRQGCPISALLYVLVAEPLHCKIVQNVNIKGINIPNSNKIGLIYQHADDTTLSLCNKESIPEVFKEFDLYSKATGAKINRQKSEILCLGTGTLSVVEKDHIGLKVCEDYF